MLDFRSEGRLYRAYIFVLSKYKILCLGHFCVEQKFRKTKNNLFKTELAPEWVLKSGSHKGKKVIRLNRNEKLRNEEKKIS